MIRDWLIQLGLEEHIFAFEQHEIDLDAIPYLTAEDLIELGLSEAQRATFRQTQSDVKRCGDRGGASTSEGWIARATVLCASIANATYLSTVVDAEDLAEVQQTFDNICVSCAKMWSGRVVSHLHPKSVALFGRFDSEEDYAENAIYAGLDLIQQTERIARGIKESLKIKVSIATGPAALKDLPAQYHPHLLAGETANLAAGLHEIADPNALTISEATKDLVDCLFEATPRGLHEMAGFARPIPSWRIERGKEA